MLVGDDAVEDAAKPERLEDGFDDLRGDDGEPDAVDAVRRGEGGRHGKASEVEHEGYDDDGVGDPGAVEGALDGALERRLQLMPRLVCRLRNQYQERVSRRRQRDQ